VPDLTFWAIFFKSVSVVLFIKISIEALIGKFLQIYVEKRSYSILF
jgi:hypothetical protein